MRSHFKLWCRWSLADTIRHWNRFTYYKLHVSAVEFGRKVLWPWQEIFASEYRSSQFLVSNSVKLNPEATSVVEQPRRALNVYCDLHYRGRNLNSNKTAWLANTTTNQTWYFQSLSTNWTNSMICHCHTFEGILAHNEGWITYITSSSYNGCFGWRIKGPVSSAQKLSCKSPIAFISQSLSIF